MSFVHCREGFAESFTESQVTTTGDYYGLSSAIRDEQIYFSHYSFGGDVQFTSSDGSDWITETPDSGTVTSPPGTSSETSLVFDTGGNPHIFYHESSSGSLLHAYKSGGAWSSEPVDSSGTVGTYADAVLCDTDRFCVCYCDEDSKNLKFAKGVPGSWTVEDAHSPADDVGMHCDVVEAQDGTIYVAHYNETDALLVVSERALDGTWSSEEIDYFIDYGMWPSIAIDSDGTVEVYASRTKSTDIGESDAGLFVAIKSGVSPWSVSQVDNDAVGGHPAAMFSSTGRYRVIYRYLSTGGLFPPAGYLKLLREAEDGTSAQFFLGNSPFCYPRYRYLHVHEHSSGRLIVTAARDQNASCDYGIVVFTENTPTATPTATSTSTTTPAATSTATPTVTLTPSASPAPTNTPEPMPTATPSGTPTPSLTCTLAIRKVRNSALSAFKVTFRINEKGAAEKYTLEGKKRRSAFKRVARGRTKGSGVATKRLIRTPRTKYRAVFASGCTTAIR